MSLVNEEECISVADNAGLHTRCVTRINKNDGADRMSNVGSNQSFLDIGDRALIWSPDEQGKLSNNDRSKHGTQKEQWPRCQPG